jgi:hypothetical protein
MKQIFHYALLITAASGLLAAAIAQAPTGSLPATPPMPGDTSPAAMPLPLPLPVPAPVPIPAPAPAAPAAVTDTALPPVPPEPVEPASAAPTPNGDSEYSFGTATDSVLFTKGQTDAMKNTLRTFEGLRGSGAVTGEVQVTEALPVEAAPVSEPGAYPIFQLASVAYHTDKDWTVWVNNARITPKNNGGEVKVIAVKPDRVWFSWAPSYAQAVVERYRKKAYAPTDPVKHRLTIPNTASMAADGTVMFSLRPNQSFVAGYFATFEGKPAAPALAPLAPPEAKPGAAMTPEQATQIQGLLDPATGAPVDADMKRMDELITNRQGIMNPQRQKQP